MYYLATYDSYNTWHLREYKNLNDMQDDILKGETHGSEFKVLKELPIVIKDSDDNPIGCSMNAEYFVNCIKDEIR